VSVLSSPRARPLYRIGNLYPPEHPVSASANMDTVKGTSREINNILFVAFVRMSCHCEFNVWVYRMAYSFDSIQQFLFIPAHREVGTRPLRKMLAIASISYL